MVETKSTCGYGGVGCGVIIESHAGCVTASSAGRSAARACPNCDGSRR